MSKLAMAGTMTKGLALRRLENTVHELQVKQHFEKQWLENILVDMGYDLSSGVAIRRREPLTIFKNRNLEWLIEKISCDKSEK